MLSRIVSSGSPCGTNTVGSLRARSASSSTVKPVCTADLNVASLSSASATCSTGFPSAAFRTPASRDLQGWSDRAQRRNRRCSQEGVSGGLETRIRAVARGRASRDAPSLQECSTVDLFQNLSGEGCTRSRDGTVLQGNKQTVSRIRREEREAIMFSRGSQKRVSGFRHGAVIGPREHTFPADDGRLLPVL